MKICFIGFGNMASAMAQYLIKNPAYEVTAASPSLKIGTNSDGMTTHSNNAALLPGSSLIILAVKPDKADLVLKEIGPILPKNSLLISVVSGLKLSQLATYCPANQAIVRSMPNLPISIGKGATPLIANHYATPKQKQTAEQLFESAGIITWLTKESDIDSLTALSGSGPAYLFYFLEAMMTAGENLGLESDLVKSFVLQTVEGAILLAKDSELPPSELRKKVTSARGTTAAALTVLDEKGFKEILFQAIKAAKERAEELGSVYNY